MHQNLSGATQCSAMLSSKRPPLSISASVRSISQPSTRCSTPGPALASYRSHSHSRNVQTPVSSQFFSNTIDPLTMLLDEDTERCNDVDHQVKLALTDLLNCSDVKQDREVRLWVQNRLMAVERRLKARRKSHILMNAAR